MMFALHHHCPLPHVNSRGVLLLPQAWHFARLDSHNACVSDRRCLRMKDKFAISRLSAYKMRASMRLFKLQVLSLFKLPFSISGQNRSLNEHLRAKFGLT